MAIPGHGQWCSVREDTLIPLILDFFDQRVFGASRLDLLSKQRDAQPSTDPERETRARLTRRIADADAAIAAQVRGLEAGVDPLAVKARIEELRATRATWEASLTALPRPPRSGDYAALVENLIAIPDLGEALREAEPDTQRAVFDAFALRVACDRVAGNVQISALVDEDVATTLGGVTTLSTVVCTKETWRGQDSNLRRQSQRVYSASPLTAREPRQGLASLGVRGARHRAPGHGLAHDVHDALPVRLRTPRAAAALRAASAAFSASGSRSA